MSVIKYLKKTKDDYDVVLASHNMTALLAHKAKCKNIFYYVQAYEPEFYDKPGIKSFIKRKIAEKSYDLKGIVKVVNADIYRNYKNLKSDYVVPPGLDLEVYHEKNEQWDGKRGLIVGCIGRTEEWKGSRDVARAVELLKDDGCDITFRVAFNPVECKYDYESVKPDGDLNLADFYRSIDVLVAPGKLQLGAIHYPVIEAMACGTVVVTTGYYPANKDNSYIVPISSPSDIANAIRRISEHYDEAKLKTERASEDIKQFDWKQVSKKFIDIIEAELKK